MKRSIWFALIVALTTSASHAEIVRRNQGVQKILPGNQITVSGNGVGVVTVGVDGAIALDTASLKNEINLVRVATGAFASVIAVDTTTLNTRINQVGIDTGTFKAAVAVDTGTIKSVLSVDSTTLLSMITFTNNATSTNSVFNDNQSIALSTTTAELQNRSVPVRFSNEGSNLGNVTAVDCVGAGVDCTNSGSTVTITVTATGGGGVTNSTFPYTMGSGGDVFRATNTFVPVPGASYFASVATETTYSFQAFTLAPSTVGSTFFKVAKASASNDAGISTSWTYVSPHMEVATGTVWSQVYSSAVRLNPGESFALHVTSYAVTGRTAAEFGLKIQRWIEALTQ